MDIISPSSKSFLLSLFRYSNGGDGNFGQLNMEFFMCESFWNFMFQSLALDDFQHQFFCIRLNLNHYLYHNFNKFFLQIKLVNINNTPTRNSKLFIFLSHVYILKYVPTTNYQNLELSIISMAKTLYSVFRIYPNKWGKSLSTKSFIKIYSLPTIMSYTYPTHFHSYELLIAKW